MSAGLEAVGVELVEVPRFARVLDRFGKRLLERVFTADEVAYAQRKKFGEQNLAARFAAKCAGRRALQLAGQPRLALRELEVVRKRSGEPTLAVRREGVASGMRIGLTLTHDQDFAMASLWIERDPARER